MRCHQFKIVWELLLTRNELKLGLRLSCKSLPHLGQQLKPHKPQLDGGDSCRRRQLVSSIKKEVLFLCAPKVCPTWTGKQEVMRLQVFITLILHSGGTCGVYAICAEGTCDAAKSQTNIMCGQCFQLSTDTHTHTYVYIHVPTLAAGDATRRMRNFS